MATLATEERLLTADEYAHEADRNLHTELVRGRIVAMNMPTPRHGQICVTLIRLLDAFVREHDLGHVIGNDSGVITHRGPDTVRGADVAFYSFSRVPRGPLGRGYLPVFPEVVFEVRSPTDRWGAILTKVGEYLIAGVSAVCVLDEMTQTARVYEAVDPERVFGIDEELVLPAPLDGFRITIRRFFE